MVKSHNILLIEPSAIIAEGLHNIISHNKKFVITDTLSDFTDYTPEAYPSCDIVIINPIVVALNQYDQIKTLISPDESKSVILMTSTPADDTLAAQYDGLINIYSTPEKILQTIQTAINNMQLQDKEKSSLLSSREKSILAAVATGKSNKEIAESFNISVFTVMTHRKNISHKLGINSIAGLTVYAIINNIIEKSDL